MTVLLVLLVVCVGLFAVAVMLAAGGAVISWGDPLVYNATFLLAAAITGIRAASGGSRTLPWYLVSFGLAAYVLGRVLFLSGDPDPLTERTVAFADVFWLLFYPVAFVSLLVLTKRHLSMRLTFSVLDSLLVGAGAFAVGLAILDAYLLPDFTESDTSFVVLNSLNLVGDLVLLVLVLAMAQAFNWRPPPALWFLIAAGVVFSIAVAVYLVQVVDGTYVAGGWVDLLWPVTALLVSLGAMSDRGTFAVPEDPQRLTFLAPSIALLAAGFVLIWSPPGPLQAMATASAAVTIVLAVVRLNLDVRESLNLTRQLRRARVDSLTGLPNRRSLLDLVTPAGRRCSVILLDLDAFKDVNHTMGHDAGDQLLVMVARRLRREVAEADVVMRLEGDEFGIVLWDADATTASTAAESLILSLESTHSLDGVPLLVTACAGVVESLESPPDVTAMLRQASVALAAAKADGPGLVRMSTGEAGEQTAERLRLRAQSRAALNAGGQDFVIHYQPLVSLDGGSVLAVEALVRWRHDGHLLHPSDFLRETMRGGQMADLTRLMLTKSLTELRDNALSIPVNVNVPPELMTGWILKESATALSAVGVGPSSLIVEITEEALMRQPEAVAEVLTALRARGVRVLLDDFGTGWSGLSSLRDLIVDGLKIDHSFVLNMAVDPSARAIVRSVATLAADLGLLVVYEGADDPALLGELFGIGTGYVQSYAIAAPMPVADLVQWMDARSPVVHA